jgi:hypothetical protein
MIGIKTKLDDRTKATEEKEKQAAAYKIQEEGDKKVRNVCDAIVAEHFVTYQSRVEMSEMTCRAKLITKLADQIVGEGAVMRSRRLTALRKKRTPELVLMIGRRDEPFVERQAPAGPVVAGRLQLHQEDTGNATKEYYLPDDVQPVGGGGWGGFCTCPNGQRYGVGDNNDACESLACVDGIPSKCNRFVAEEWAGKRVVCGSTTTKEEAETAAQNASDYTTSSFLPDDVQPVGGGGWGGFCTCPNGQRYGVGDNNDNCESLACEGGMQSPCNKFVSDEWALRKVVCGKPATPDEAESAKQFYGPNIVTAGVAAKTGSAGGFCTLTEKMNLHPPCVLYTVFSILCSLYMCSIYCVLLSS